MRSTIGVLFILASFLGTIYFRRYHGSVIPYPTLWYFAFIALGLVGVLLIFLSLRKTRQAAQQFMDGEVAKLKAKAERIVLDFDKCEFKSGTFYHEVEDENMTPVKIFAPASIRSIDTKVTESVVQSYLTYTELIDDKDHKFVSHAFPFDQTVLKMHVLQHSITLYVNRFNREEYMFELK